MTADHRVDPLRHPPELAGEAGGVDGHVDVALVVLGGHVVHLVDELLQVRPQFLDRVVDEDLLAGELLQRGVEVTLTDGLDDGHRLLLHRDVAGHHVVDALGEIAEGTHELVDVDPHVDVALVMLGRHVSDLGHQVLQGVQHHVGGVAQLDVRLGDVVGGHPHGEVVVSGCRQRGGHLLLDLLLLGLRRDVQPFDGVAEPPAGLVVQGGGGEGQHATADRDPRTVLPAQPVKQSSLVLRMLVEDIDVAADEAAGVEVGQIAPQVRLDPEQHLLQSRIDVRDGVVLVGQHEIGAEPVQDEVGGHRGGGLAGAEQSGGQGCSDLGRRYGGSVSRVTSPDHFGTAPTRL